MITCHACGAWMLGELLLPTCEQCAAMGHDQPRAGPWTDEAYLKEGKVPVCKKCGWSSKTHKPPGAPGA